LDLLQCPRSSYRECGIAEVEQINKTSRYRRYGFSIHSQRNRACTKSPDTSAARSKQKRVTRYSVTTAGKFIDNRTEPCPSKVDDATASLSRNIAPDSDVCTTRQFYVTATDITGSAQAAQRC